MSTHSNGHIEHAVVMGCPRSGTTFLMHVFDALPHTECVTGGLLPVAVPHVVNHELDQEVYNALAVGFERSIDSYLHSGRCNSRSEALRKWVTAPSEGFSSLLHAFRGERTIERFVYKEPFLAVAPEFVADALPQARLIHIYRDGRDCANSLRSTYDVLGDQQLQHLKGSEMRLGRPRDSRFVPWWVDSAEEELFLDSSPYVRAIWMWKFMVRRAHEFFSRPDVQGRAMEVCYEDLVRNPIEEGHRILRFLGAEPNRFVDRRLKGAHTSSIGSYQRRDAAELAAAEEIAAEELDMLGYERAATVAAEGGR